MSTTTGDPEGKEVDEGEVTNVMGEVMEKYNKHTTLVPTLGRNSIGANSLTTDSSDDSLFDYSIGSGSLEYTQVDGWDKSIGTGANGTNKVNIKITNPDEEKIYGGDKNMLKVYDIIFVDVLNRKFIERTTVVAENKEDALIKTNKPTVEDLEDEDIKTVVKKLGSVEKPEE